MNLRRCFPRRQQLFPATLAVVMIALSAVAQERIVYRDGRAQDVKILGTSGSNVQVQVGAGSIGVPIASIKEVIMNPPSDYADAVAAYDAGDYPRALAAAKAVADKFKGLPTEWAQHATAMVGDIYIAMNRAGDAEAAYKEYQKAYPGAGSLQADVGMARIALSKKDFAEAKEKLDPIAEAALKQKNVPKANATAYSQAFFLRGQAQEGLGEFVGALEDYCRTVTIFYHDRVASTAAQERADALRKEHRVAVP